MKAIVVREHGAPEVLRLEEADDPTPGRGEVVVRLHAVGVNPVETYRRAGGQGYNEPLPFTPGSDGSGVIESVADDVPIFEPGDRVYVSGSIMGTRPWDRTC